MAVPDAAAEPAQHSHPSCHVSPARLCCLWHRFPLLPPGQSCPSFLPAEPPKLRAAPPSSGLPLGSVPSALGEFQASAPPLEELLTLGNCGAAYVDFFFLFFFFISGWFGFWFWVVYFWVFFCLEMRSLGLKKKVKGGVRW